MKKLNSSFDAEINEYKDQISLGRKCIQVLEFDSERVGEEIGRKSGIIKRFQNKSEDLVAQIR